MDVSLSYRLLELRRKHGYTQEKLAGLLGCDTVTVTEWELAESIPDNAMVKRLCEIYSIPVGELLPGESAPPEKTAPEPIKHKVKPEPVKQRPEKAAKAEPGSLNQALGRMKAAYPLIVVILFLLAGNMFELWDMAWLMFLSIPLFYTFCGAYGKGQYTPDEVFQRFLTSSYPIIVVAVFLSLGVAFNVWSPTWILFLTIPLFYIFRKSIFE